MAGIQGNCSHPVLPILLPFARLRGSCAVILFLALSLSLSLSPGLSFARARVKGLPSLSLSVSVSAQSATIYERKHRNMPELLSASGARHGHAAVLQLALQAREERRSAAVLVGL